jgi:hypothetical protein
MLNDVGTPVAIISQLHTRLHVPLSTLRWQPHGWPRMTRDQDGSLPLLLSCMTLSFTTARRLHPGALSNLLILLCYKLLKDKQAVGR